MQEVEAFLECKGLGWVHVCPFSSGHCIHPFTYATRCLEFGNESEAIDGKIGS